MAVVFVRNFSIRITTVTSPLNVLLIPLPSLLVPLITHSSLLLTMYGIMFAVMRCDVLRRPSNRTWNVNLTDRRNGDIGEESFVDLIRNGRYVDKSLFVDRYLKLNKRIICLTRPPGWGKTVNLSMLKKFLEIELDDQGEPLINVPSDDDRKKNRKYFVGDNIVIINNNNNNISLIRRSLKISQSKEAMIHQGRYPILYLDFREICGYGYRGMQTKMKRIVGDLFKRHKYLKRNLTGYNLEEFRWASSARLDYSLLGYSVRFLSRLLRDRFGHGVYIFVDHYDEPIKRFFYSVFRDFKRLYGRPDNDTDVEICAKVYGSARFRRTFLFLWTFLEKIFEENDALHRGLMTGVFDIKFANHMAGLTNVARYTFHDEEFNEFYGFSETEIVTLLSDYSRPDRIRNWYGYNLAGRVTYRPLTIERFLKNHRNYDVYLYDVEDELADYLLSTDVIQNTLHRLDDKVSSNDDDDNNNNNILRRRSTTTSTGLISRSIEFDNLFATWYHSYLSFSGYFNYSTYGFGLREISVPNLEIRTIIRRKMSDWLRRKLRIETADLVAMYEALADFRVDEFRRKLEKFLPTMRTISARCTNAIVKCLTHVFQQHDYLISTQIGSDVSDVTLVSKPNNRDDNSTSRDNAILIDYKVIKRPKYIETETEIEFDATLRRRASDSNELAVRYPYVKRVLKMTLIFCRRELGIDYRIDPNRLSSSGSNFDKYDLNEVDEDEEEQTDSEEFERRLSVNTF